MFKWVFYCYNRAIVSNGNHDAACCYVSVQRSDRDSRRSGCNGRTRSWNIRSLHFTQGRDTNLGHLPPPPL